MGADAVARRDATTDVGRLVVATTVLAALALTLALATRERLPAVVVALPVLYAVAIVTGLAAAYLLRVRATAEADDALAWAAAGYGVATLAMFLQILGFPSFAPGGGVLGTTSTGAAGLYVVWHLVVPAFAIAGTTPALLHRRRLRTGLVSATVLVTVLVAWGGTPLPALIAAEGAYTPLLEAALVVLSVLSGVATWRWYRRSGRGTSWAHAWVTASLALCFWDIAMHSFAQERFTVFWWSSLAMRVSQFAVLAVGLLVGMVSLYRQVAGEVVRLDASVADAVSARDDLRDYTRQLAHDLRNPLAVAMGVVETIELHGAGFDDRAADLLRRATRKHHDMVDLIDDVLAYAEVDTATLRFAPVDLAALVDEVAQDHRAVRVVARDLPEVVADRASLRRLLDNLFDNATKYARPDVQPLVDVAGSVDPETWSLVVVDNGRGIPHDLLEEVFQSYARGTAPVDVRGTGLGLALCRRVAERHGGTLRATSDGETGTTFTLTVPVGGAEVVDERRVRV